VQAVLRRLFQRWGRPLALRVDNGTPWASTGDWPTELALWLRGLDVAVWCNPPRQPQRNGVIERMQGLAKSWGEPHTCQSPTELQRRLEQLDQIQRAEYPHGGQPSRLAAHPGLAHSGRPYSVAWEREHWEEAKVLEHLASYAVPRRVSRSGRVSLYNRDYYVGEKQRGQQVWVLFDPLAREWVCTDAQDRQLRRWPAPEICKKRIVKMDVSHRG
jgi:hypothetical protein